MYTLFGQESKQFDYFLSVFLYKSIWKVGKEGDQQSVCVAYKYSCIGFPNF